MAKSELNTMRTERAKRVDYTAGGMPQISIARLEQDIIDLSQIGRNPEDNGVYRSAFSDADMEARQWLLGKIALAGIKGSMDGAGNVFGLDDRAGTKSSFLFGSHLDSVPRGGVLDGALGVLAALECMRVIKENQIELRENLELVATSDEEGRFGGMLGAQAVCGEINLEFVRTVEDMAGNKLADCMESAGLAPLDILKARRHREYLRGFLELHIEQGPVLEANEMDIGVVESISGIFKWKVTLSGSSNHAGTTPMNLRRDSFQGLCEFSNELPRILEENASENARATIGQVELYPGNPHVVPGRTQFTLVGREFTESTMSELEDSCRKALFAISRRRGLKFDFKEVSRISPIACDKEITDVIAKEAEFLKIKNMRLSSGAGHDAQVFGKYVPMGMIFIPSLNGVSHSPEEWSSLEHIEMGANLLLRTVLRLLGDPKEKP